MKYLSKSIKVIFLVFVVSACLYVVDTPKLSETDFSKIIQIPPTSKAALLTLSVFIFILLGFQLKLILSSYEVKIKTLDSIIISISNTLLNHLPAKAGLIVRGIYLKKIYKVSYENYGILLLATNVTSIATASTFGIASFFLFILTGTEEISNNEIISTSALILGGSTLFSITLLMMPPLDVSKINKKIVTSLSIFASRLWDWKRNSNILKKIAYSCSLIFAMNCARLYLSFHVLNVPAPVLAIIFIQSCVSVSIIFSITPGNIGLKEGIILTTATAFNIHPEAAILAAIIDRLSALIPTFILGPISILLLKSKTVV